MSETLQGVLLGGVIGLFMPIIALINANRIWKKEKKMERIKQKKEFYEKLFEKTSKELSKFLQTRIVSTDILDCEVHFPGNVLRDFKILLEDDDKSPEKTKSNYWILMISMKKYLKTLDDEIDQILK